MARQMAKLNAPDRAASVAAEEAITTVLGAERAAREDVERAQREAQEMAERARAGTRALAERTERRIRRVVAAFEAELAERLAQIEAQAREFAVPHALNADELAALGRAVSVAARELTGAPP